MMFGTYERLDVHVMASDRAVIRAALTKLTPEAKRSRDRRLARHAFLRLMLGYHADARRLYCRVFSGDFSEETR